MESIVWLVIFAGAAFLLWKYWPKSDTNNDGKVDINDAVANIKADADVNKDGKVDLQDAIAAAHNVKKEVAKDVAAVKAEITKVKKKYGGKVKKSAPKP